MRDAEFSAGAPAPPPTLIELDFNWVGQATAIPSSRRVENQEIPWPGHWRIFFDSLLLTLDGRCRVAAGIEDGALPFNIEVAVAGGVVRSGLLTQC